MGIAALSPAVTDILRHRFYTSMNYGNTKRLPGTEADSELLNWE